MASYEKDDLPMLSDSHAISDENVNSQLQISASRTRSISFSIPIDSRESYETEPNLVGHTGPLRNERKTPFVQMSGPLYVIRNRQNTFRPNESVTVLQMGEHKTENFPSSKAKEENDWAEDSYARKNEHLLRSGQLGMCNDPYCTICPTLFKAEQPKSAKGSGIFDVKFHNFLYGDAKGWARRFCSSLLEYCTSVKNPHAKVVQKWNKFFVISCLVAIFVDPCFFFLLAVQQKNKCIFINMPMTSAIVVVRSMTDFVYLLHMLLQFRLAYFAPDSRVVGVGQLVDHPKKIALNYLRGYFLLDLFTVLPLPQIMILSVIPNSLGSHGANYAKNVLRVVVLLQFIPRFYRLLPLLAGRSTTGHIFESAWVNFIINLLTFVLAGHIVGSCWYLFGLERVNDCLRHACHNSPMKDYCMKFTDCGMKFNDCGHGNDIEHNQTWKNWTIHANAAACFMEDGYSYGIYVRVVNLTTEHSIVTRYVYSLFWGFQQISTLAGNQTPSYSVLEVLFTMGIIGLGLLLFAFLIGNMQNFLQALVKRKLDMSLRSRDMEQWMSHRRLPEELRKQVRAAERYNWAATRGVDEETLFENLPEDLQTNIRRHLFKFVKKVRIFSLMDEPILDAVRERLRQKTYISGSNIFYHGGPIEKMVFIVRGKMESIGEDGIPVPLSEGDVCGEELLTWCLEHSAVNRGVKRIRSLGQRLISNRAVVCVTNVEAFSLQAVDIEEVTRLFARFLRKSHVQGAIRYESPYWRSLAAIRIQVAWRYRKKRLNRADTSQSESNIPPDSHSNVYKM